MKVAVIGAGSTYTPELVSGLAHQRRHLAVDQLSLMDVDADRLDIVGGLAQRMLAAQNLSAQTAIELTTDRGRALDGADAVLIQFRVGGQRARLRDETFPAECSCVGQETTGAGGAAKALRTVPVALDIAEEVSRRSASQAWIIDFTNPVGIVTRSLLDAGHRVVGLCNYAIGVQRWAASLLDVTPGRVQVDPVGLNHCSWTRRILVDGVDVLPNLLRRRMGDITDKYPFPPDLIDLIGAIPSYYLNYYYRHDEVVRAQQDEIPRAQQVAELEKELLTVYADKSLDTRPALLEGRGGAYYSEAAVELLAALFGDTPRTLVLNVRNQHTVPGLAEDDVIEVPCDVSSGRIQPLPQAPVPDHMLGIIQHVSAYERQTARAAVTGDVDELRRALLSHPLIGQYPLVEELLPRLLRSGARHLPQFAAAIAGLDSPPVAAAPAL